MRRARELILAASLGIAAAPAFLIAQDSTSDWRADWSVAEGFALDVDTEGYQFPTSIAVVPDPGDKPRDPLYFVTEIQGTIKVVTNDRTVHVFARVPAPADDTLPNYEAEIGLAGICLEPRRGYVFATYAYRDAGHVLRNALVRFQSTPGHFGVRALDSLVVRDLFAGDAAAVSHQIGPCQAEDGALFVSVVDGERASGSQDPNSTLGKILRLDYEGHPAPGNPFAGTGTSTVARAVWALGLRNPFGLRLVGDRLFAADNGIAMDRFVEITRGRNYLWDGTDRSIGAAAAQTLSPAVGPVQLTYCRLATFPDGWRDRFYLALSGRPAATGPHVRRAGKGVLMLDYGFDDHRMRRPPEYLIRYRGTHAQAVVGIGCGPDRLYIVPLLPDTTGRSVVLTARYAPGYVHPHALMDNEYPLVLMEYKNCLGCHEWRGMGREVGPALDYDVLAPRLRARLEGPEYRDRVRMLDSLDVEPFSSYRAERARVLQASGDARLLLWIRYRLREPKFDNPDAQMPNLELSDAQAVTLAEFLLTPPPRLGLLERARLLYHELPQRRRIQLAVAAVIMFTVGAVAGAVALHLVRRRLSSNG